MSFWTKMQKEDKNCGQGLLSKNQADGDMD